MCDKELLIGYLYDDMSDVERRALEAHLASCLECRDELAGLRATRVALASWTPAEADLGFQIVRGPQSHRRTGGREAWLPWLRPAWALAAAAVLVLAAGAAIANLDVRYGSDGLTIRTGWAPHAVGAQAAVQSAQERQVSADDVVRLEGRLQALEASVAARPAATVRQASTQGAGLRAQGSGDADVLREVRQLLSQSESRQQRELALRLTQVIRDFERQRRIDMATIQQGLQSATGADAIAHRQMMDYVSGLYRVSQQVK